ncbi:hypothetical protein, partial [Pantoea ananatis]|uniref:hypothetical protein n=1 Tax=Pantoea ananas TaxID=553 RepID=UPI001B316C53
CSFEMGFIAHLPVRSALLVRRIHYETSGVTGSVFATVSIRRCYCLHIVQLTYIRLRDGAVLLSFY